ncbi:MAG: hypothetical protein RI894_1747, partial [Bacteroidota bacterium]
ATSNTPTVNCSNATAVLSASGAANYAWSSGITTVNPAINTTYTVTGTAANGCTATATVAVNADFSAPMPSITGNLRFCAGSTTTLTATGGSTYNWSANILNAQNNKAIISNAGIYSLTVTAVNGCTAIATAVATVIIAPTVSAGRDTTINLGETILLHGAVNGNVTGLTYHWLPTNLFANSQTKNQTVSPAVSTTYTFYIETPEGCRSNNAPITVTLGLELPCMMSQEGITPNSDGINDTWELPCLANIENTLEVYNRWGQLLYTAQNYTGKWGGVSNGQILPDATYYYIIKVKLPTNLYHIYKGTITIIR